MADRDKEERYAMTTPPTRPLTPMERAILRAVVELGDGAYGVPVRQLASDLRGHFIAIGRIYTELNRLEEEGFVRSFEWHGDFPKRSNLPKRCWKPAFDLTEVLREP